MFCPSQTLSKFLRNFTHSLHAFMLKCGADNSLVQKVAFLWDLCMTYACGNFPFSTVFCLASPTELVTQSVTQLSCYCWQNNHSVLHIVWLSQCQFWGISTSCPVCSAWPVQDGFGPNNFEPKWHLVLVRLVWVILKCLGANTVPINATMHFTCSSCSQPMSLWVVFHWCSCLLHRDHKGWKQNHWQGGTHGTTSQCATCHECLKNQERNAIWNGHWEWQCPIKCSPFWSEILQKETSMTRSWKTSLQEILVVDLQCSWRKMHSQWEKLWKINSSVQKPTA